MPESVESPAPERTTTSPSATRSASASTDPVRGSAVGAAVTGPWSLRIVARAARSPRGEFSLEPVEDLAVHPAEALGREDALEETAAATPAVPGRPHVHGGGARVGRDDGPCGDHGGVGVGLDQPVGAGLGD